MKPSLLLSKWRFLLSGFALVIGVAVARETEGFSNGPVLCPFRLVTGYPCPFCGTTRAVGSLLLGDISASIALNPLGLFFAVGAAVFVVRPEKSVSVYDAIKRRLQLWSTSQQVALVVALSTVGWLRALA